MIVWLCHNKPGGTKLDGTNAEQQVRASLWVLWVWSVWWWRAPTGGKVGWEEVQFIKPGVKQRKTSWVSRFYFIFFLRRMLGKISRPTQVVQRNISQPRLLPGGVKLWWRSSEAVPKATVCMFTAAEEHWGLANMPAPWLAGSCLSPCKGWELPP